MLDWLKRLDRKTIAITGVVLAVLCFLSVNLFSSLTFTQARLDLTEERLYTLSTGTRNVLATLKEPIKLRLYASRSLKEASPQFGLFMARVQELVQAYDRLALGKIKLEILNPEPFTPEEDRAVGFGLRGVPLDDAGSRGYFGLVGTNSTDDHDVIPIFSAQRESFLEYDLTRLVYNLAHPEKPVIGFFDGIAIQGSRMTQFKPWQVLTYMRQFFSMRELSDDIRKIDDDIKVVLVIHPQDLEESALYALDQFVLRGGRVIVFVDPHTVNTQPMMTPQGPLPPPNTSSNLEKLMTAWGVEMVKDKVVGDRKLATRVQAQRGEQSVVTEYILWFGVNKENLAQNEVITGELEQLRFLTPGSLKQIAGAKTKFTPLAWTTDQSMLVDLKVAKAPTPDPIALLNDFKPDKDRHVLAARITGPATSAFDAPPVPKKAESEADKNKKEEPLPPHIKESTGPISVIVVADVDMLADRTWLSERNLFGQRVVMPFANNADFAINMVENFTGSQELISLRGRGVKQRTFDVVDGLQREAEIRYRQTEQSLQKKLEDLEKKLSGIEGSKTDQAGNVLLTQEQQELVKKFRSDIISIRSQLREVQHALRKDIDALETWLKAINIVGMPIVITIIAFAVAIWRRRRPKRRPPQRVSDVRT
jgi:ABC-type uncharacterized transport system involved in gliding motility auxiliary subunit